MPSDIQVTNIKASDGTAGLVIADSSGQVTGTLGSATVFPAGHVIKTTSFISTAGNTDESSGSYANSSITSGSYSHGSGNKILIMCHLKLRTTGEGWYVTIDGATGNYESEYYTHDGTHIEEQNLMWLDSPSGTSTTYTVKFKRNSSGTATFYNNRSSMVLQEIKG
tara:strand:+ start:12988 stop:13485 length:498 start_codon:yes stop_codon:yes gene_type:complete